MNNERRMVGMKERLFEKMDGGRIEYVDKAVDAVGITWKPHPIYAGVSLKTLIDFEEAGGRFSSLLVRLQAGSEIGEHIHDTL
ncbi:MAG: hypothetical protein GXY34_08400 [Syntrophomonadaceae bacterium]|nr:hypothetical protein [Syntrophomonadaceae bacterium]